MKLVSVIRSRVHTLLLLLLTALAPTAAMAAPGGDSSSETAVAGASHRDSGRAPGRNSRPELLTAEEVTQLSQRAEQPGPHVVGGALTNQQLTYIVIALATAVIVLILK